MKFQRRTTALLISTALLLLLALGAGLAYADGPDEVVTYRVTIDNLASGQPLSPPVAATHQRGMHIFRIGHLASAELEAIAEDGNQGPMFNLLSGLAGVTDAVDVGRPLTPRGKVVGDFTDSVTFEIMGRPGDRFSLATMLICTNDGFTGLDSMRLPARGSFVFPLIGFDAGTEDNTELSGDIVDPCSALGPLALAGDPNGNEDAAVDSSPHHPILPHRGILGGGDLSAADHGWREPVARVTITRLP